MPGRRAQPVERPAHLSCLSTVHRRAASTTTRACPCYLPFRSEHDVQDQCDDDQGDTEHHNRPCRLAARSLTPPAAHSTQRPGKSRSAAGADHGSEHLASPLPARVDLSEHFAAARPDVERAVAIVDAPGAQAETARHEDRCARCRRHVRAGGRVLVVEPSGNPTGNEARASDSQPLLTPAAVVPVSASSRPKRTESVSLTSPQVTGCAGPSGRARHARHQRREWRGSAR